MLTWPRADLSSTRRLLLYLIEQFHSTLERQSQLQWVSKQEIGHRSAICSSRLGSNERASISEVPVG